MRVKKDAHGIYDFDVMVTTPRLARVGKEIVDVSIIPVAVTLAMASRGDMSKADIAALGEDKAKEGMLELFQLMSDVCVQSNPKVTRDFLMKHLNPEKFAEFMKFVMNPLYDKVTAMMEEVEDEPDSEAGNAESDETTSD